MKLFAIVFFLQAAAITLIVGILKKVLDRNLIDLAAQQLETGRLNPPKGSDPRALKLVVVTHKKISDVNRERVLKAVTKNIPGGIAVDFQTDSKILGGMRLSLGENIADYSLVDRLRRAR